MTRRRRAKSEGRALHPSPFAFRPSPDHYVITYQPRSADPSSLSSNRVWNLLIDRAGVLWIGTDRGLYRLDPPYSLRPADDQRANFTRYARNVTEKSSLLEDYCSSLLEARDGSIWIGTRKGLSRMTPANLDSLYQGFKGRSGQGTFENYGYSITPRFSFESFKGRSGLPQNANFIVDICEDRRGALWLATFQGLFVFDPQKAAYQWVRHDAGDPASLSYDGIRAVYCDRSGAMWIGTMGFGLSRWDQQVKQFHAYTSEKLDPELDTKLSVYAMLEDRRGLMWIFTNYDWYQLNRQTGRVTHHPLEFVSLETNALHEDPDLPSKPLKESRGFLWITNNAGVFRYDPDLPLNPSKESRGRIEKIFPQLGEPPFRLHAIYEDNNGDVWFGSFSNLSPNAATSPAQRHALYRWNRQTEKVTAYPLLIPETIKGVWLMIVRIIQDQSGVFWLGTNQGLFRFHPWPYSPEGGPQRGALKIFRNEPGNRNSLTNNEVKTLLADPRQPDRFLWLGTNGGGLNRFDLAAESFSHYTEEHGLLNNVVYGILSDDAGNLWMSTNKGLSKAVLTPDTGEIVKFINYDVSDGLQSNEFNTNAYFKNGRGEMFFGGIKGFNVFHPDSIRENSQVPPVVLTDLQVRYQSVKLEQPGSPLQKTINTTEMVTLAPEDNVMTFEFAALDYSAPEKNLYSYKLESFDEDWSQPSRNRRATYTNLKPGTYVFRVRASNNDGAWNEAGARLVIEIMPYFYQTAWFAALGALALGLTVYGGYRWRLRYLQARRRELEKLAAERTTQLRASEESLRQLNEHLEQRVLERTDELQASRERLRALSAHLQSLREQDRVTIARDLHDELGQVLTSLKMDLSMLERKAEHGDGKLETPMILSEIESMQKLVAATITKVRNLITELRPEVLDTLGLLPALEWQLEEFCKRTGLTYEFCSNLDELNIPKEHAVAVFRIFQESLTNIARHAQAGKAKAKIEKHDHALWVEIADDGKGISAEDLNVPGKFGLLGMRERALVFGGEVTITGASGQGTTVKIKVPIAE